MDMEIKMVVCKNCGGDLKWNIGKQQFECGSCHSTAELNAAHEKVVEHALDNYAERDTEQLRFADETLIACSTCGAQVVFDKHTTATVCPMCGSAQVAEKKQIAGVPPDGIIPFKVDKVEAQENFRKWVKHCWFAPNRLKKSYQEGKMDGIYIPFWTFDADADVRFVGRGGTKHYYTDSNGDSQTEVRWKPTKGQFSASYDDLQVCASDGREAERVAGILPYDTSNGSIPYSSAYLSGFGARRYAVRANEAVANAKEQMESDLELRAKEEIENQGYDEAEIVTMEVDYTNVRYKHVLLPAWISVFTYGGEQYLYMVNGESGTVDGNYPFSIPKIVAAVVVGIAMVILLTILWLLF